MRDGVEQIFGCHIYLEDKKIKLVTLKLTDCTLVWWDQMQKDKMQYGEHPITT